MLRCSPGRMMPFLNCTRGNANEVTPQTHNPPLVWAASLQVGLGVLASLQVGPGDLQIISRLKFLWRKWLLCRVSSIPCHPKPHPQIS